MTLVHIEFRSGDTSSMDWVGFWGCYPELRESELVEVCPIYVSQIQAEMTRMMGRGVKVLRDETKQSWHLWSPELGNESILVGLVGLANPGWDATLITHAEPEDQFADLARGGLHELNILYSEFEKWLARVRQTAE